MMTTKRRKRYLLVGTMPVQETEYTKSLGVYTPTGQSSAPGTVEAIGPDEAKLPLGALIRHRRELLGYSKHELARILGVTPTTIVNIEAGVKVRLPKHATLCAFEDVLGVDRRKFIE